MRSTVILALALLTLTGCGKDNSPPVPPPTGSAVATDDNTRIRGLWMLSSLRLEEGMPDQVPSGGSIRFENANYSMELTDHSEAGKFTLIPTTNPKQIDLATNDGGLRRGLYILDGDKLSICMPVDKEAPRPTEFKASAEENRVSVIAFTRSK